MKNTGILEVARRYLLRIIFSKIFTDIWQHSVFAGGAKTNHFSFEIFVHKPLEN